MLFSGSLTMGLTLRDIHTPVKINVALMRFSFPSLLTLAKIQPGFHNLRTIF